MSSSEPAEPAVLETQARLCGIGLLAAGIAHELSNPLAFLKANTEHLRARVDAILAGTGGTDPAGLQSVLEEMRAILDDDADGIRRMVALTAGLRTVSRPPGPPRASDVEEAIDRAIVLARGTVRHRAEVVREFGHPPEVLVDEVLLTQVFVNLLVNAAHAIDGYGRIRLATSLEAGMVAVRCVDTGCGMPPEVRARLFEPFFTTKPAGVGTGLGLYIVRRTVESAGGRIEVESAPGQGTTFLVAFPPAPVGTPR